jgi:hypothetical protein
MQYRQRKSSAPVRGRDLEAFSIAAVSSVRVGDAKPPLLGSNLVDGPCRRLRCFGFSCHADSVGMRPRAFNSAGYPLQLLRRITFCRRLHYLFQFSLRSRCTPMLCGIADLDPRAGRPGSIGAIDLLGNDALGTKPARMGEGGRPIFCDVLV